MITLVVRHTIRATPERLFDAWTRPEQLVEWWGPEGVTCIGPSVDVRVGGAYRIGNRMPDGSEIWIAGVFEAVERPHLLTYTWRIEGMEGEPERVTVRFEPHGTDTEVIVTQFLPATVVADEASIKAINFRRGNNFRGAATAKGPNHVSNKCRFKRAQVVGNGGTAHFARAGKSGGVKDAAALHHGKFRKSLEGVSPLQTEQFLDVFGPISVHPFLEIALVVFFRQEKGW